MNAHAAALEERDRREAARARARALPPLTDNQVARIAVLLTLGRAPEAPR